MSPDRAIWEIDGPRQIEASENAIVLSDTTDNVVLAEKVATDIDKHLRRVQ